MSHFSVFVITDSKPSQEDLHKILLPWHEYECTGFEEYVQDIDVTDEIIEDHKKHGEGKPLNEEWALGWNGAELKDGRYYRRTNVNRKWDWWQIGGRWTGMLIPRYDPLDDPRNKEKCPLCNGTGLRSDKIGIEARKSDPEYKCNGCQGSGIRSKWATDYARIAGDQVQVKDIPFNSAQERSRDQGLQAL
jgi:hypothetical protein